ncbi:MAG: rod shape-determining protein MreC, partial [bacterium]|nr:rod shape-determining protein MreC [bacterium]
AKTENGAVGIIKGGGGSLTLGNVLLSENINSGEFVLTYGDINQEGIGVPQDLIIGKITEIEKNPSDLFQKAKVESFVDFASLLTVFVYIEN